MGDEAKPERAMKKTAWGFDVEGMDRTTRAGDDFYQYAVGGWLKKNTIPPDEPRWGSFLEVRKSTDERQKEMLDKRGTGPRSKGSKEQLCFDFYDSVIDMDKRNKLGIEPIRANLESIRTLASKEAIIPLLARLQKKGHGMLFSPYVGQDDKASDTNIFHFYGPGLGMPDREYYIENTEEHTRVRTAYQTHIVKILLLAGRSEADANRIKDAVMRIETNFAKHSLDKVARRDPDIQYNKLSWQELKAKAPHVDWDGYMKELGVPIQDNVLVPEPELLTATSDFLHDTDLEDIKLYLEWELISGSSGQLSQAFIDQNFEYYGRTLNGQKEMKPLWRRALGSLNGNLGELFGQLYVERHFTKEAKEKMNALVDDLFQAYEKRILALDWLSDVSKEKAIEKLKGMNRKIGFPDVWRSYDGLVIDPNDYMGNAERVSEFEFNRIMNRLGKPVDRTEWFTPPQTVNAFYSPSMNEIVFPAGVLQPPFFDVNADDAVNYAGIGSFIGHEMTHGFDDQGSKFDTKGNLKDWWTSEDRAHFDGRTEVLVEQFNQFEVEGGIKVNGKLTLGENIADLGGILIAFDAYHARLAKTGRTDIDGFTPEQRFFLTIAQNERELENPESIKTSTLNDPHSPAKFRVNGPLSHVQEFYDAFGITETDPMYVPKEKRAHIW